MNYVIATACIALCIVVIVFGLKVLKESKEMGPKKKLTTKKDDDDEELRRLRPR